MVFGRTMHGSETNVMRLKNRANRVRLTAIYCFQISNEVIIFELQLDTYENVLYCCYTNLCFG